MLNADDLRRCECCEEPTKKVVGFWEGHDSYSGSPRAGAIYSCDNHECDICKEKMSEKESDELLKERVKVANLQNGTDAELLRRGRMSVRVALDAAADIIGVSAAEYSAKENGRMPITREEYHNILMPLFEAIKAISEGKRCGQCRYYRESGYFRHREAATGRAAQRRSESARRLASDGNHALTARSDFEGRTKASGDRADKELRGMRP